MFPESNLAMILMTGIFPTLFANLPREITCVQLSGENHVSKLSGIFVFLALFCLIHEAMLKIISSLA